MIGLPYGEESNDDEFSRFDTVLERDRYDTIRYDTVYLTCSKKLTGNQLSPPHGTNKKIKM